MGTRCIFAILVIACLVASSKALNPSLGFAGCPNALINGHSHALLRMPRSVHGPSFRNAASLSSHGSKRIIAAPPLSQICMSAQADDKIQKDETAVNDDERLLGSRRLAAASKVIRSGTDDSDRKKLFGSKRLSAASEILIKTPRDKDRMLGSKRLRKAREILFRGSMASNLEDKKLFGSTRLASAKNILTKGIQPMTTDEMKNADNDLTVLKTQTISPEPMVELQVQDEEMEKTGRIGSSVAFAPEQPEGPLQFGGIVATEKEIDEVQKIRQQIKEIPAEERAKMTVWVDELLDVDIFRYVHQFKNKAFEKIKETAVFRAEEGIDNILQTDAAKFETYFEPGKEEIVYLAPDKQGRPILLYRSAYHWPGVFDPKEYTRYILYQTEKTRLRNGLGVTRQSCVLVDRIGSGGKNQDPALLKVLLPTVLNHYPMYIGNVYIAPISTVFFIVWKIIQFLLDEATKKRFFLLKGDYTAELLQIVDNDSLPSTLGGGLDVPDFCAKMRNLDKAEEQLAELEEQMDSTVGDVGTRKLAFDGKEGTEQEIMEIAELRVNIASLTPDEHKKYGGWLQTLENVDLLRFLRVNKTPDAAWTALLATATWREENKINTLLDEDLSKTFAPGKQEVYMLPPDNKGRPVFVYRSGIHFPGQVPNQDFVRFVLQIVEKARQEYGLGLTTSVNILVDRVGSGRKNQDIGLLQDLVPVLQTHYPQTVGAIYIAPINMVFFIIWQLASLLFDEDTKNRVVLVRGDVGQELLKTIPADVLPKNLGGTRPVPEAGVL